MQITISILKRIIIKSGYHSKMSDKEARILNSISNQVFVLCGIFCSFLLSAIYRFVLDVKNVPVYVIVLTSVLTLIGFILLLKNVNRIIRAISVMPSEKYYHIYVFLGMLRNSIEAIEKRSFPIIKYLGIRNDKFEDELLLKMRWN